MKEILFSYRGRWDNYERNSKYTDILHKFKLDTILIKYKLS